MGRRPPRPTLVPYTPRFGPRPAPPRGPALLDHRRPGRVRGPPVGAAVARLGPGPRPPAAAAAAGHRGAAGDRPRAPGAPGATVRDRRSAAGGGGDVYRGGRNQAAAGRRRVRNIVVN